MENKQNHQPDSDFKREYPKMDDQAIDELVEEGTRRIAELFYQLALDQIKREKKKQSDNPDSGK
jgi:hypothetical protein